MTAIHFTDPGGMVDNEWANAEDVLGALRGIDRAVGLSLQNLHAGRLSNASSDPIGFEAGNNATLYLHPYLGTASLNMREDGTYALSEIPASGAQLDVSDLANGPWDVFEYDEGGESALEVEAWSDENTRGYTLAPSVYLGYVKPLDPTRKWRGVIRMTAGYTLQNNLTQAIWNQFNRVVRAMKSQSVTASWSFTAASVWRVVTNVPALTIVSPGNAMPAYASYNIGLTNGFGASKIAVGLQQPGQEGERVIEAVLDSNAGSLCAGGELAINSGAYIVRPYEFVTATATFVGQTQSHLGLLWEC